MKVLKSSRVDKVYTWWHVNKYEAPPPVMVNLCSYFRAVFLWSLPRWFVFGSSKVFRAALVIVLEAFFWACTWIMWDINVDNTSYNLVWITYILVWILLAHMAVGLLLLVVGIIWTGFYGGRVSKNAIPAPIKSFGGLVKARAKAVHDSICPTLYRE